MDLEDDGIDDAVITDTLTAQVHVLLGQENGMFEPPVAFSIGIYPSLALSRDLNGDSNTDLVIINRSSNDISVLWGNGIGGFPDSLTLTAILGPNRVVYLSKLLT